MPRLLCHETASLDPGHLALWLLLCGVEFGCAKTRSLGGVIQVLLLPLTASAAIGRVGTSGKEPPWTVGRAHVKHRASPRRLRFFFSLDLELQSILSPLITPPISCESSLRIIYDFLFFSLFILSPCPSVLNYHFGVNPSISPLVSSSPRHLPNQTVTMASPRT